MGCGGSEEKKEGGTVTVTDTIKGMPTLHMMWVVPKEDEEEIDAYWKTHEEFLRSGSHHVYPAGDIPQLLEYYIAKGEELSNPADPASEKTGNLMYIMSETYAEGSHIGKHMELAGADWPGMAKMAEYGEKYGKFAQIGSASVIASMSDDAAAFTTPAGSPSIQMVWKVPADMEGEMDAYWKSHEDFMRATHAGVDEPKCLSYYIAKGKMLNNPMDMESGETGDLMYIMSETYAEFDHIPKHFALADEKWPGLDKMGEYAEKLVFIQAGACSVLCSMA